MSENRGWDESRSPQWRYMLSKDAVARKQIKKAQEKLEKRLREEDAEEKTSPPTIPHSVPSAPRKMKIKRKGLVQTNTPSTRSFEE
jgi:hypothetical protein